MASIPVMDICISTLEMFIGLMKATLVMSEPRTKKSSTRMTATIVLSSTSAMGPFSCLRNFLDFILRHSLWHASGWFPR